VWQGRGGLHAWWRAHRYELASAALARAPEVFDPIVWWSVAGVACALGGERRRAARAHQIRARRAHGRDPRAGWWTLAAYGSYARYYVETLRAVRDVAPLLARMEVSGHEELVERARRGEGFIVALAHMGNWDLAGAWAAWAGLSVTAVAERLPEEAVTRFFDQARQGLGIEVVEPGVRGTRVLLRTLRTGGRVALVVDRDVTGTGRPGTLFGSQVPISAGPAVLAVLSGAPVFPVACYQLPHRRHLLRVWPPIAPPGRGPREARIDAVHRDVVRALERQIELAPAQWHNLAVGAP